MIQSVTIAVSANKHRYIDHEDLSVGSRGVQELFMDWGSWVYKEDHVRERKVCWDHHPGSRCSQVGMKLTWEQVGRGSRNGGPMGILVCMQWPVCVCAGESSIDLFLNIFHGSHHKFRFQFITSSPVFLPCTMQAGSHWHRAKDLSQVCILILSGLFLDLQLLNCLSWAGSELNSEN